MKSSVPSRTTEVGPHRTARIDTAVGGKYPTPLTSRRIVWLSHPALPFSLVNTGMLVRLRAISILLCCLMAGGCAVVKPHSTHKSPLAPLTVSPDAIMLEVFSAPAPAGVVSLDELWQLVDEQPLDPELRRRLAENGFRAGIVGPSVPAVLGKLLKVSDKRISDEEKTMVPLDSDRDVSLRLLYAKSGKRNELVIPHTRERLVVLEHCEGQVRGKTYDQADCRLELRAFPEDDGRVRIELTPEIHHGVFQSRVRGSDGQMRFTQERPKRVFADLKLAPRLAPGQMLLVAARSDRPGSAGYHFFTDTQGDKPLPMVWVVRASRDTPDQAFYDGPVEDDLSAVSNDFEE